MSVSGRNSSKRAAKGALPASDPQIQLWVIRTDGERVAVPAQPSTRRSRPASVKLSAAVRQAIRDERTSRE